MATFEILPAELNCTIAVANEFGMSLDFSTDLTGFTWSAEVFEVTRTVTTSFPGGLNVRGTTAATITVTVIDAAAGQINLSMQEAVVSQLSESQTYRWELTGVAPGSVTRTYVSGSFAVRTP